MRHSHGHESHAGYKVPLACTSRVYYKSQSGFTERVHKSKMPTHATSLSDHTQTRRTFGIVGSVQVTHPGAGSGSAGYGYGWPFFNPRQTRTRAAGSHGPQDSDGLIIAFTEASSHHLYASRHFDRAGPPAPATPPLPPQPHYDGEDSQDDGGDMKTTTDDHSGGDNNVKMITAAVATTKTVKTWQRRKDNHSSGEDEHGGDEDEHGGDDDMRMIAMVAATAKTVKTVAAMQGRPWQRRRPHEDDHGGDSDDMKTTMAAVTTAKTIKMTVTIWPWQRRQHEDDHGDDVDHAKMIMAVATTVKGDSGSDEGGGREGDVNYGIGY
ncbi:hypothetical protein EDB84DRAFT_1659473 [Lactarius hengduanensis]|nr:hypothetical protein EDB84DRAFT_1659473 [Lactarius hengduanensis]